MKVVCRYLLYMFYSQRQRNLLKTVTRSLIYLICSCVISKQLIQNNLKNTWENYQNQLFILSAQEKNVLTSQDNFNRTEDRYKLGQVTSIEFRQAQINLLNAKTAFNNAKFDAKLIEIQLLQLSGDILNVAF